jgi:hypothetical protein
MNKIEVAFHKAVLIWSEQAFTGKWARQCYCCHRLQIHRPTHKLYYDMKCSISPPLWHYSPSGPRPTSMNLSDHFGFSRSYTFGRTPWAGDQLVARPLPVHKHRKTHTHKLNIHALSGIRSQDPGFQASEDSTCLRPLGYRDRRSAPYTVLNGHGTTQMEH